MAASVLGIDIGTGKVAVVICAVPGTSGQPAVCDRASVAHGADLAANDGRFEQDVEKLWGALLVALGRLNRGLLSQVQSVGFCGQMHGCVLLDRGAVPLTPLITWRDKRTGDDFVREQSARTGHALYAGQAAVTLAFLARHNLIPPQARAATIMDLFARRLTGRTEPVIDPSNAHSWGFLKLPQATWDLEAFAKAGIPADLLPTIVPSGGLAGVVSTEMSAITGIPQGAKVGVAIGDHQASLLGSITDAAHQIALTLGSGGQCGVLVPHDHPIDWANRNLRYEVRPFPDGQWLICSAALAGGLAWQWLADFVKSVLTDMGVTSVGHEGPGDLSADAIFARLNQLGTEATDGPIVNPRFFGERGEQESRGEIRGIDFANFRLGPLARGLATGIVANLNRMLPPEALAGRTGLVLSGNAFRRNPLLRDAAERVFALPIVAFAEPEEAAVGAAIVAARLA